jgi:hypothetical protein
VTIRDLLATYGRTVALRVAVELGCGLADRALRRRGAGRAAGETSGVARDVGAGDRRVSARRILTYACVIVAAGISFAVLVLYFAFGAF